MDWILGHLDVQESVGDLRGLVIATVGTTELFITSGGCVDNNFILTFIYF